MSRQRSPRKHASNPKSSESNTDQTVRINRLLASAGFGSRRQCEELIEGGRVELDGEIVTSLSTTLNPETSKVRVDGVLLKAQRHVYYAINKPTGVVTTNRDPQGRPRVIDLAPPDVRVFPVGRLDRNSEGLILLTNDGDLAQALTHPKFGVRKIYRVVVAGKVTNETMRSMRKGIHIAEGFVRVEGAKLIKSRPRATEMEIILQEGKNREIRRILARLGHKVQQLRRVAVGPLRLGDLPSGACRVVTPEEVKKLRLAVARARSSGGASGQASGNKAKSMARDKQAKRSAKFAKKAPRDRNRRPLRKQESEQANAPDFLKASADSDSMAGTIIGGDTARTSEDRPGKTRRTKAAARGRNSKRSKRSRSSQPIARGSKKKFRGRKPNRGR